jgi:hypothetical protein
MKPQSYERKILRRCNANTPLIKNLNARIANMEASQNVGLCVTLETFCYLRGISILVASFIRKLTASVKLTLLNSVTV